MKRNSNRTNARFPLTKWDLILDPAGLDELCQTYWNPVYAVIRRWPKNPEDAEDITQGFFKRLLDKITLENAKLTNYLETAKVKVKAASFRYYLLTLLKYFLADEREREQAIKRGGDQTFVSIDEDLEENGAVIELEDDATPADVYDLHWAQKVLGSGVNQTARRLRSKRKKNLFDELQSCLTGAEDRLRYVELGTRLTMSENAIQQEVARLRETWRKFLNAEVATTVSSKEEIKSEIQYLKALISRHPRAIQIRAPKRPSN